MIRHAHFDWCVPVNFFGFDVCEILYIKGMVKNHCLAKAISDVGWYEVKRQLKYKSEWFGKLYLEIDRFDPSSKCCSGCGWKNDNLRLSDRLFVCSECGLKIDRDLNAAINIRNWGLKQYRGTHGNSRLVMTGGSCRKTGASRARKKNASVCLE